MKDASGSQTRSEWETVINVEIERGADLVDQ
jgi:hypothetical protein